MCDFTFSQHRFIFDATMSSLILMSFIMLFGKPNKVPELIELIDNVAMAIVESLFQKVRQHERYR